MACNINNTSSGAMIPVSRHDTEIKLSSSISLPGHSDIRTPDTSVERLDYINKRELHSSVFSTDKFSELYLDNLVDDDDFKLVWNMATDTRGASGAFYDTGRHQSNSSTSANRYRLTEAQHVSFLKRLEEVVQKQLPGKISSTFASSGNFPLSGGEARCGRKPDIFTVHRDTTKTMKDNKHAWPHMRVVGELKETKEWIGNEDGTNANRQAMVTTLARYVREMFCQPGRRYIHAFSFCGKKMRKYLFDRAGVLCSYSFNIDDEPQRFLRHVTAYLIMSSESLGFDPYIKVHLSQPPDESDPYKGDTYDITLPSIHNANLQPFVSFEKPYESSKAPGCRVKMFLDSSKVVLRPCISSRGTTGWPARIANGPFDYGDSSDNCSHEWTHFVKIQWRSEERPNEGEFLKTAGKLPGVIQHYFHTDLAAIRGDIRRNYQIDGLKHVQIKVDSQSPRRYRNRFSTAIKRSSGGTHTQDKDSVSKLKAPYNRIQTMLVMCGIGRPLRTATTPGELLKAIRDAIIGHRGLYEKNILHRDISYGNIVITPSGGALIDVDYAIDLTRKDPSGAPHRTGTPQFMAIDVCEGKYTHTFRHDLESVFYVLLWTCTYYGFNPNKLPSHEGLIKNQPPNTSLIYQITHTTSFLASAAFKTRLLVKLNSVITHLAPGWKECEALHKMICTWKNLLSPNILGEEGIQEADETLYSQQNGVLYKGMLEALDIALLSL